MKKIILLITIALLIFNLSVSTSYAEEAQSTEAQPEENISEETVETKSLEGETSARTLLNLDGVSEGSTGKGALLSPLLSESFQTDLATGAATASVPIVVPPGRKNMQPNLALRYSSNNTNGICGLGWELTKSSIQRSTKEGLPRYDDTDTFAFASAGSRGDLVRIDDATNEYRQKVETGFMKYIYDDAGSFWTVWDKSGTRFTFGSSIDSRIVDPSDTTKIFAWHLDSVQDVYGNTVLFTYMKDGSQIYISQIDYTSNDLASPALTTDKAVELLYEDGRPDIVSTYRSGFNITTNKRLKEIVVKVDALLVWRYVLDYSQSLDTNRSLVSQVTLFDADDNSLPPKQFRYQTIE